jgi:hypothetical protein
MKQFTQAEISMPYKPAPMTLGNVRANSVRTLTAWYRASAVKVYAHLTYAK